MGGNAMLVVRRLQADQIHLVRPLLDRNLVTEEAALKIRERSFFV